MSDHPTINSYQSNNYLKYTAESRLYQWHIRAFQECLFELLDRANPDTILDAGCGEGFVVDYLLNRDPQLRITGVDVSDEAITYARHHFGDDAHFRTGNVYRLPFPDNTFDTVICSEVLEHLESPDLALKELKRVARKYVLITVPREPYFKWLNEIGKRLNLCGDPGHVNFWTEQDFRAFMEREFDRPVVTKKNLYQLALADV